MASLTLLLTATIFLARTLAQSSPTSYVEPTVPTGVPITGNYGGQYRPQIHFSPPKGFMNDPNGMFVDASGLYHLYYQCSVSCFDDMPRSLIGADNPTDIVAGNQHWGMDRFGVVS